MDFITPERKNELITLIEDRLNVLTNEIDNQQRLLNGLQNGETYLKNEHNIETGLIGFKNLLRYRLLLGLILADLSCSILFYLRAKTKYEGAYSNRQTIVIICEGFKKIYHFVKIGNTNKNPYEFRNESFWIKEIGFIISNELPNLEMQYLALSTRLDELMCLNFELMKNQRDFSVHYDKLPERVYEMMSKLEVEETFDKAIKFSELLNEMVAFCTIVAQEFHSKSDKELKKTEDKMTQIGVLLSQLENSTTDEERQELMKEIFDLREV